MSARIVICISHRIANNRIANEKYLINKIVDEEIEYETRQANKFVLRLGTAIPNDDDIYDNIDTFKSIPKLNIAENPFCCGVCGNCNY